ncbi:Thiamine biosynthesis lipoprotein ApbE precursor [Thalassoglobus neptunius]|uniref:FAD:protein FMN transferase n=1 Tax=Thalassoglobus neptunius TaxID=1938619 RepID=A0A5C5VZN8_9PLAN|nr:DUF2271 domain-containing protein [Thalassoglobus neptunius]TWT43567.1 Thiamine biosynthesis lipoprotein ApbE precursor [Thalassoglobus neptunius]
MTIFRAFLPFLFVFGVLARAQTASASDFQYFHENVLGTSLEIRVDIDSEDVAAQVESTVLEEIDRLDQILSRYKVDSELMRWQRGENVRGISDDLAIVLSHAEQWRVRTGGAFDVRSGVLDAIWDQAEKDNHLPSGEQLKLVTEQLTCSPWRKESSRSFDRNDNLPVSLDGLAKGYILDSVCMLIEARFPSVRQMTINIGGDLRKTGQDALFVAIADPENPAVNTTPLARVEIVGEAGVATSGGYHRTYKIDGHQYSHILDPRTGQPVKTVVSATVIAPTAMESDAAATAVSVLGMHDGIRLIEKIPGFECLILDEQGEVTVSSGWPTSGSRAGLSFVAFEEEVPEDDSAEVKTPAHGIFVDFSLPRQTGGRYRRPYVAVWLEDEVGYPVKIAVLWLMKEQLGARWYRDLTRWYRSDRLRRIVEESNLIETVSSATRGPGEYDAHFDGTDNLGRRLPYGKYTLCLEVAREHGTYQIIRQSVQLGTQPIEDQELKGNDEINDASFRYVPWPDH